MHPLVVGLLEMLLAVAARDRGTFSPAERGELERALFAVEARRYALEDSAVWERIAALQAAQGGPVKAAP